MSTITLPADLIRRAGVTRAQVEAQAVALGWTVQGMNRGPDAWVLTVAEASTEDEEHKLRQWIVAQAPAPVTYDLLRLTPLTGDYVLTAAESGTVLGSTTDSVVTVTLPADPPRGFHADLVKGWSGNLRMDPAADARLQYPAGGAMGLGEYLELQAGAVKIVYAGTYQSSKRWLVLPYAGSTLAEETP